MNYEFFQKFLDLLFPMKCAGCAQAGEALCRDCREKIKYKQCFCAFCGTKDIDYGACRKCVDFYDISSTKIYWTVHYKNPSVKKLIKDLKYRSASSVVDVLGKLLTAKIKNIAPSLDNNMSVIIPVPLHKRKIRERGFNQSELLAKYLADKINLPIEKNILIKIKNTSSQVIASSRRERLNNLKGSFDIRDAGKIKNKTVILVDDVITTGATIIEASRTLKKAGCKNIIAVVVAH